MRNLVWLRRHFLHTILDDCIYSWSPRSTDLSPLDFLWSFLKNKIYHEAPTTIEKLKQKTETEIKNIDKATCKNVYHNLKKTRSDVY